MIFGYKKIALLFVSLIVACSSWSQHQKKLNVLMIGDSNTENGNIAMPLKEIIDSIYGNYGTGYCTFNPNSTGRVPNHLTISCDSNWTYFDMRNAFEPVKGTYFSPNGLSISSTVRGAETVVHFTGNAIDIYYLLSSKRSRFLVMIDGKQKGIVEQKAGSYQTKKAEYGNLGLGSHIMKIKVVSGNVTLLGLDAKGKTESGNQRAVLHKWGNAWSSTADFLHIDKTVFQSALKLLNPDKVVILLGTNDYNLDHRNAADFKSNIKELTERIKKALPHSQVMIVSTFDTDGEEAKTMLTKYIATSFPEAARETRSAYWDMYSWFGSFDLKKLPDGVHVNEFYGKKIAEELFKQCLIGTTEAR